MSVRECQHHSNLVVRCTRISWMSTVMCITKQTLQSACRFRLHSVRTNRELASIFRSTQLTMLQWPVMGKPQTAQCGHECLWQQIQSLRCLFQGGEVVPYHLCINFSCVLLVCARVSAEKASCSLLGAATMLAKRACPLLITSSVSASILNRVSLSFSHPCEGDESLLTSTSSSRR